MSIWLIVAVVLIAVGLWWVLPILALGYELGYIK